MISAPYPSSPRVGVIAFLQSDRTNFVRGPTPAISQVETHHVNE